MTNGKFSAINLSGFFEYLELFFQKATYMFDVIPSFAEISIQLLNTFICITFHDFIYTNKITDVFISGISENKTRNIFFHIISMS